MTAALQGVTEAAVPATCILCPDDFFLSGGMNMLGEGRASHTREDILPIASYDDGLRIDAACEPRAPPFKSRIPP